MKLGGIFSGVGGFELAWQQLGGEIAWMCEVDRKARAVLQARFPGVTIYEDVREINPAEVEAVDILTGGSPCQGFSIAGKREGLQHEQSQLFAEYLRIMDGLAERGLQWAVWENVPGLLSIRNETGERTFPHVIGGFLGAAEPASLPERRKWGAGVASYGGREVAWRILDSQHFGVPQRRRRVFACVSFGHSDGRSAGRALLAESEGLRGDSAPGGTPGQEASGAAASRTAGESRGAESGCFRITGIGKYAEDGTGSTVRSRDWKEATDLIVSAVTAKWAKGTGGPSGDEAQNLAVQAFNWQQGEAEHALADEASALASRTRPAVLMPQAFDEVNFAASGTHQALRAGIRQSHAVAKMSELEYRVRRLTPTECERLQGFPDGWTDVEGASDTSRYRAMGNAVTVPTVRWVLARVLAATERTTGTD